MAPERGITLFELDRLVRKKTLMNIADTYSTLQSLSILIDQMENMVVEDHIADSVRVALKSVQEAVAAMGQGRGVVVMEGEGGEDWSRVKKGHEGERDETSSRNEEEQQHQQSDSASASSSSPFEKQHGDFERANLLARRAIQLAESAFFDPTMVSMLYFPTEHTYAVYMPFFVPALVPIIVALLREIIQYRKHLFSRKKE